MVVSNKVYSGQLHPSQPLESYLPYATKFYNHRPRMIVFRSQGITLLIFTTSKFRIMGKGTHHRRVLREFLQSLPWRVEARHLSLRTMSLCLQIPYRVNLHKLDDRYFRKEYELFPAAQWISNSNEHFNIFHTGSIVITGVKDINKVEKIMMPILLSQLENALFS